MQAILLAAGDASRLAPLSHFRPKGMLLLGGKPILQHQVESLVGGGVKHIVIVIGSHGERIQSFFGDGADFGCEVTYAQQSEPTGTADAVRCGLAHVDATGPVVIVPGHLLFDARTVKPVLGGADRLLLSTAQWEGKHWVPTVSGSTVTTIQVLEATPGSTRVSTGIFHASPEFLSHFSTELTDIPYLDEAVNQYAKSGHKVKAVEASGDCNSVVEPWDMLRLNDAVLDQLPKSKKLPKLADAKQPIHIGKNTTISSTASIIGPVTIGDGCHIGDRTIIGPYVSIRNNSVIGSHCEIRRSIINNNVSVDSRAVIRGSILDDGVECGPNFIVNDDTTSAGPRGCIIGADATIGPSALAMAGAVVEPGANISERATLAGE